MNWLNFLWEVGKVLTNNQDFSIDSSQDTQSQVNALVLWATQLMWATALISQKNLTWVLLKAKDKIIDDENLKKIDEDKMIRLIWLSTQFWSEEMQEYISWILAWEYNQPWSFSFKTLEVVKNLGKEDVELFRKFCGLIFDQSYFFSNFYNLDTNWHKITNQEWIWYYKYLHLIELGLVLKNDTERYMWVESSDIPIWRPEDIEFSYDFHVQWEILQFKKKWKSKLSFSSLTTAGRELFPIIWFEKNDTLLQLVKSEFINQWFYE